MPIPEPRPLIVRLRNWVGDVTLSLPMLQRLAAAGFELTLLGKGWARDLLAGQGWSVHALAPTFRQRVAQLRQLRQLQPKVIRTSSAARQSWPALGLPTLGLPARCLPALCLPDSFSSALEFRLAGLPALGHAWEGRSALLGQALPRPRAIHEFQVYWQLGDAFLGRQAPLPTQIRLQPTMQQMQHAQALRQAHGLEPGCILICPFAGGTWDKMDKTWPGFAEFVAQGLRSVGRSVVVCPGPGEEERIAREQFAGATLLPGVNLGVYAALLKDAALLISNDTGPGHMAAAVGAPLVSVMGPSDPSLWRPWGHDVQVLGGHGRWPEAGAVMDATRSVLNRR